MLLLTLLKRLPKYLYTMQLITVRITGSLPQTRWRIEAVWFTELLAKLNAGEYKILVDTGTQCTLMSSKLRGLEPICVSSVARGFQELYLWETKHWNANPSLLLLGRVDGVTGNS